MGKITFFVTALVLGANLQAQEITPGKTVKVKCKENEKQTYLCYLPIKCDKEKTWPILFCFCKSNEQDQLVKNLQKACEEKGWIIIASSASEENDLKTLWKDTHDRFKIETEKTYSLGLEQGTVAASILATLYPKNFSGSIHIGIGTLKKDDNETSALEILEKNIAKDQAKYISLYLMTREKEEEIPSETITNLEKKGFKVESRTYQSSSKYPSHKQAVEAIEWLTKNFKSRKDKTTSETDPETQKEKKPGFLGVIVPDQGEAKVQKLIPDSPAAKAGMELGDVIIKVDGKEVDDAESAKEKIREKGAGQKVKITVSRDGDEKTFEITLGIWKDEYEKYVEEWQKEQMPEGPMEPGEEE